MFEEKYIIAVDQSTTGTKAVLINHNGEIKKKCYKEHRQIFPHPGWVEHDPMEVLKNVRELIVLLVHTAGIGASQVQCIAITNQRETVVAWDKLSGVPVYNAIVWQCNRAGGICEGIRRRGLEDTVQEKTGLPLSEFFSAAKLSWIMERVGEAKKLRDENRLLCGTVDSWLIWNLSKEKNHVTDYSNASRMELLNLNELKWDAELLTAFGLERAMMPRVIFSDEVAGHMEFDGYEIPIAGVVGDSHGALFAQSGLEQGVKVTYGTGSSIMAGTGNQMLRCTGLATTVAYAYGGKVTYAVEGNINSTGATIKWVADKLELIGSSGEAEATAVALPDNGGVYFVPAFVGLGAPYWDASAKAVICGMTYNTDKRHIVRAALESIAFQIEDVLEALEEGTNMDIAVLCVDGKPTENKFLMKFQAGISEKTIMKNCVEEASCYGSAMLAGLATGYWRCEDIPGLVRHGEVISPEMSSEERASLRIGWRNAVRMSIGKE